MSFDYVDDGIFPHVVRKEFWFSEGIGEAVPKWNRGLISSPMLAKHPINPKNEYKKYAQDHNTP